MTETGLALASSSFGCQWKYDVFINFRGQDTRHGFTGNLYNALKKVGVYTFFDDEELKRGDEITPGLLNAIENSRMAITVFSENYASSAFCLEELVRIHECIKKKDRLVLPIFYNVEPSKVRYQTGQYGKDLSMHKEKGWADEETIQRWKVALKGVANISGDHFIPGKSDYEYQVIESIVKEISSKITRAPLHVSDYPVGLEYRVKEITSLLQIGSNDKVIMVGICGIGGVGKSTIARTVYNSIADNFEGLCFLHVVKGESEKLVLKQMQERILSKIVGVDIKIDDVYEGVQAIKKRFKEKKILLILDNVENHEQLKKLAGGCNWFSDGSRIIITTRNEQLLVAHGVKSRYHMEVLNDEESLQLLSWNAFRNRQVDPCYKDVLNRVVSYAQGLPLALELIGSNLCRKNIDEWESALLAYKLSLHEGIQKVLRVSYVDLEEVEKEIFLDIACLFNGEEFEYVKHMVEAVHDYDNLSYSIGVLADKHLIKIEKFDNCIQMHDLIRDMGIQIVREESSNNPGERSRLWFHKDIVDVLERNTGTNKVRMIVQDNQSECIKVNWDGEAFKSMKELKMIIFVNVKFLKSPKYLPESLKVLKWRGYPSCLPLDFNPKKLVMFDMGYSCLRSLETIKTSYNLGVLNLERCKYVENIPDLSNLNNLKELTLYYCENLIGIHGSVGYLPKLKVLIAHGCVRLKNFPRTINLPSLTELRLAHCSSLEDFPEILEKVKIKELFLYGTRIKKLPWSICNLSELRQLEIEQKESVIEIPSNIFLLPEIEDISVKSTGNVISCNSKEGQEHAIWSKQCLNRVKFELPRCNISDDILRTDLSRFMNVRYLNLSGNDFTILPAWMKECHFLDTLVLNECKHLREVEGIPRSIRRLEARNSKSLSLEFLLSEELHGDPDSDIYWYDSEDRLLYPERNFYWAYRREPWFFWVPSESIPNWFDHTSKGPSISFWIRNSFPLPLCLCLLLKRVDVESDFCRFYARVDINEEPAFYCRLPSSLSDPSYYLDGDHLVVCRLEEDDDDNRRHFKTKKLRLEKHRWHRAQVGIRFDVDDILSYEALVIEEIGIYVSKRWREMQDISFTNPDDQTLDSTWGNQETSLVELDLCTTSPQALHWMDYAWNEYVWDRKHGGGIGDDECLSLFPCRQTSLETYDEETSLYDEEISLYDEAVNPQELQQQKDATSTNVEQGPKSFEDTRKAKGKEIVLGLFGLAVGTAAYFLFDFFRSKKKVRL